MAGPALSISLLLSNTNSIVSSRLALSNGLNCTAARQLRSERETQAIRSRCHLLLSGEKSLYNDVYNLRAATAAAIQWLTLQNVAGSGAGEEGALPG
jgi:hypothetical protein